MLQSFSLTYKMYSRLNVLSIISETTEPFESKLNWNDPIIFYGGYDFYVDQDSNGQS